MQGIDTALETSQSGGQNRAAADIGQGEGELIDQLTPSEVDDALNGGDGPLSGPDDEGQQLHDVGQLDLDAPSSTLDLPAEPPVAAGRPTDQGHEGGDHQQRHAHMTHHRGQQPNTDREGEGGRGPQELLQSKLLVGQGVARSRQPMPHRLRRRSQPLEHVAGRTDGRQKHGRDRAPRAPIGVRRMRPQQARDRGLVVDVGGETVLQRGATAPQRRDDQEHSARRREAGQGSQGAQG